MGIEIPNTPETREIIDQYLHAETGVTIYSFNSPMPYQLRDRACLEDAESRFKIPDNAKLEIIGSNDSSFLQITIKDYSFRAEIGLSGFTDTRIWLPEKAMKNFLRRISESDMDRDDCMPEYLRKRFLRSDEAFLTKWIGPAVKSFLQTGKVLREQLLAESARIYANAAVDVLKEVARPLLWLGGLLVGGKVPVSAKPQVTKERTKKHSDVVRIPPKVLEAIEKINPERGELLKHYRRRLRDLIDNHL